MDESRWVEQLISMTGGDQSLIGDDCAVLDDYDPPLVVTTDNLNYNVHFDCGFSPSDVGAKLTGVNLSDVAGMGASPCWALLSISSNRSATEQETVTESVTRELNKHNVKLVGGDVSGMSGEKRNESYCMTIIGKAPHGLLTRDRAQPGDRIAVTGELGTTTAIRKTTSPYTRPQNEQKILSHPPNRIQEATELVKSRVRCGMDISDGLAKDLGRILNASGVGARLNPQEVPVDHRVKTLAESEEEALGWALFGGEDYELLITIPETIDPESISCPLEIIGEITKSPGIHWEPDLPASLRHRSDGFDHFQQ